MLPFRGSVSRLALVVAMGIGSAASTAYAQTDDQGAIDEGDTIVVTGVRASLQKSLDIKRDSRAIVDSINAEELGRFPDNNVADSLAHIPGITVNRSRGGEADFVNIRGLGPEFSIVTLNNRILATDDGGRNFAFDVLPSEIIGGADVWKTSQAKHLEGSIGGAVNLRSAKAFDNPGLQGTVSAIANHNSLSEEIGGKLTGVVSNTFADERIGIIVGVSYEDGKRRADDMWDNFYDRRDYDVNGNGMIDANEENLAVPGSYAVGAYETDFSRLGFTSALEFRPTDRLEITADVLVTKLDATGSGYSQSFFLVDESEAQERWSDIVLDGDVITGLTIADVTAEAVTRQDHRDVDTIVFGLNAKYDVTDNFAVTADVYQSESERLSGGKNTFIVAGAPGAHTGRFELVDGGLPTYIPTFTEGRSFDDFDNSDFGPHWAARDGDDINDQVNGYSLDGDWQVDKGFVSSVDFGVALTERQKTKDAINNYGGACNYCGYPFPFSAVGADVVRPFPFDNFLSGEDGNIPRSFPIFDIDAYGDALRASDGQTLTSIDGVTTAFPDNFSDGFEPVFDPVGSYDITEDTTAVYGQVNFEGDDWFANVGARYIETDVNAAFAGDTILSIEIVNPDDSNPTILVERSPFETQTSEGGYEKFLPSMNFGKYINDDLLFRFAAARSMSRPTIDQLAPFASDNAQSGVFTMTISGNPDIEPVFSDQVDAGLEWYFEDDSYLAGAVFYKDLEGFIFTDTQTVPIAGRDFRVTQPINGDSAEVLGFEVSAQKFFDNGFGITASYSYTDSSTVVRGEDAGPLPGVAENSYSLSLIYDKDRISAQVSLDHTGSLVADPFSVLGDDFQTEKESVNFVTASVEYDVTDKAQIFVEGFNLLKEANRTFQGRPDLPSSIQVYGRTFNVGARYSF